MAVGEIELDDDRSGTRLATGLAGYLLNRRNTTSFRAWIRAVIG